MQKLRLIVIMTDKYNITQFYYALNIIQMIIASLKYIHKYISLYEIDFLSKGKMQIHVEAMVKDTN